MAQCDQCADLDEAVLAATEQFMADPGVPAHDRQLLVVELALLEQHGIGNRDLAHVMQRRRHLDQLDVILGQAELLGDQSGDPRHAFQIGTGAGITELDRTGQSRQGFAFAFLDLVHAGQQPLFQRQRTLFHVLGLLAQLQQVVAARAQFARADRLDQEIDDTRFQRRLPDRLVANHGDQDHGNIAVLGQAAETAGELQPVHLRHAVIEQQQVDRMRLAPGQRGQRVTKVIHAQFRRDVLDDMTQHRPRGRLIINNDDVQRVLCLASRPCWIISRRGYSAAANARTLHRPDSRVIRPGS